MFRVPTLTLRRKRKEHFVRKLNDSSEYMSTKRSSGTLVTTVGVHLPIKCSAGTQGTSNRERRMYCPGGTFCAIIIIQLKTKRVPRAYAVRVSLKLWTIAKYIFGQNLI